MPSLDDVFSGSGLLAKAIQGFNPRQAQTDMAKAVASAINDADSLIVEAGTGTGKTFAYLAPVLLSKGKAIVSTGTKNLQEQLFHRDLPVIKKALASNRKTALLKALLCQSFYSSSVGLLDQGKVCRHKHPVSPGWQAQSIGFHYRRT